MSYLSTGDTNVVVLLNNSGFGCEIDLDTAFINAIYPAIASFDATPTIQSFFDPTFSFLNTSLNATEYYWDLGECDPSLNVSELFNSPTPFYDPNSFSILDYTYGCGPGFYNVQLNVSNMGYCPDSAVITIRIQPDALLYVPNSFTPDGNLYNNLFYPVFSHMVDSKNYVFRIYNRWGEVIFQTNELPDIPTSTNNQKGAWDGISKVSGKISQKGVYNWEIFYKLPNTDELRYHKGHVSLIR